MRKCPISMEEVEAPPGSFLAIFKSWFELRGSPVRSPDLCLDRFIYEYCNNDMEIKNRYEEARYLSIFQSTFQIFFNKN